MPLVVRLLIVLVAAPILLSQVRKPWRAIGRPFLWIMNRSHSAVTDWGLRQLAIAADARVLDVGCGGGRTIAKLASEPRRKVSGVDYSPESVAVSQQTNAAAIADGRVDVQQASVSKLPFADATFDVVTAVETHYYWPDVVADLREVRRVLKPGGSVALIAESYAAGRFGFIQGLAMKPLGVIHLTAEGHRQALTDAGFSSVDVFEERAKGWICASGRSERL
ncbi:MAG TPA: class I SAM-dependent methyltransferase [Vicinamibacterales bacterium]|nr:class I SAM-dependent methyltransferase [Vicinamibacterales bacterium]